MIRVQCKTPLGQEVRIFLNGEERDCISAKRGDRVHIRIEQVFPAATPSTGQLFVSYIRELCTYGRIMYGKEIASPFMAVWEGILSVDDEMMVSFSLVSDGVHSEIFPEENALVKEAAVRSYEENRHRKVWLLVMLPVVIPLLVVAIVGVWVLWSTRVETPGEIPIAAVVGFTMVYVGVVLFVLWQMLRRLAGKKFGQRVDKRHL